jgi:hypothetical protein
LLPNRHARVARTGSQREASPKLCARCGGAIDRETRRNSAYCSDECREEGRGAILRAGKAGDPWQFALDSRLFQVLDHRDRVHLWPADLEKVEKQRAKVARAE